MTIQCLEHRIDFELQVTASLSEFTAIPAKDVKAISLRRLQRKPERHCHTVSQLACTAMENHFDEYQGRNCSRRNVACVE